MIKSLVFDIGNVLLPFDFSITMRKLERVARVEHMEQAMEPVKIAYESGQISRTEFLLQMRDVLSHGMHDDEFIAAWEDIFTENTAMSETVRSLHGRYPLYLLSNTSDIHMDYVRAKYPVFALFKDGVYSYSAKQFKPDSRIFETAIAQFGISPDETVYIDDLKPNVDTALKLGFHGIQYDYHEHAQFLATLRKFGVEAA